MLKTTTEIMEVINKEAKDETCEYFYDNLFEEIKQVNAEMNPIGIWGVLWEIASESELTEDEEVELDELLLTEAGCVGKAWSRATKVCNKDFNDGKTDTNTCGYVAFLEALCDVIDEMNEEAK